MIPRHTPGPPPHGTRQRYNVGCRCGDCRLASARYNREWRYRIQAEPIPEHVTHGTISTYQNWGCRCADCKAAMAAYHQRRKALR